MDDHKLLELSALNDAMPTQAILFTLRVATSRGISRRTMAMRFV